MRFHDETIPALLDELGHPAAVADGHRAALGMRCLQGRITVENPRRRGCKRPRGCWRADRPSPPRISSGARSSHAPPYRAGRSSAPTRHVCRIAGEAAEAQSNRCLDMPHRLDQKVLAFMAFHPANADNLVAIGFRAECFGMHDRRIQHLALETVDTVAGVPRRPDCW